MKKLKYYWKFYIKPILFGIDPNSTEGLKIRAEKIEEDSNIKHNKLPFIVRLYLLMDGIFIGLAVGGALAIVNFVAWIFLVIACLISYIVLDYRYRDSLDEWLKYMRGEKRKEKT